MKAHVLSHGNIFSGPHGLIFTGVIFAAKLLKHHPYSLQTTDTCIV